MGPPSLVSKISMSMTPQPPTRLARSEPEAYRNPLSAVPPLTASDGTAALQGRKTDKFPSQVEAAKRDVAGKEILSYAEISRHRSGTDAWIIVDGKVYDVTKFLDTHPGGPEFILERVQSGSPPGDAGLLMRGAVGEDGHSHSKAAFRILEQFLVGPVEAIVSSDYVETNQRKKYRHDVDLTKPIVAQVGYLGPDYDEWVHDPIVSKESPRFFDKDICELACGNLEPLSKFLNDCVVHYLELLFFTRTRWWVIPLVWCPVAFTMLYMAVVKERVPPARIPGLMACGVILWTVLEYLLHRFLFHMKTSSFWGNTLHYVLHGFHHKHPMDGSRLVFPPAFASVICVLVWIMMGSWLATYPNKLVLYASALLGYVGYDLTHYYLHFGTAFNDNSRKMKRYHLNHHFKDQKNGYGITTMLWDYAFRTLPSAKLSVT